MNDDSTESREANAPQPATAIASHLVRADKADEYFEAQTEITDAARNFPGFVGTEVLRPIPGLQAEWVAIFRLESNEAMKRWLESSERKRLAARVASNADNGISCICPHRECVVIAKRCEVMAGLRLAANDEFGSVGIG